MKLYKTRLKYIYINDDEEYIPHYAVSHYGQVLGRIWLAPVVFSTEPNNNSVSAEHMRAIGSFMLRLSNKLAYGKHSEDIIRDYPGHANG